MTLFGASDLRPRWVRDEGLKANVYVDVQCEPEDQALASRGSEQAATSSHWTVDPEKTCAAAIYVRLEEARNSRSPSLA
jgi:hypothetical protein